MKKFYSFSLVTSIFLFIHSGAFAQLTNANDHYELSISLSDLNNLRSSALSSQIIELPDHLGIYSQYQVTENSLLSVKLQNEYPELKTFNLVKVGNHLIQGKLVVNDSFFIALIDEPSGMINIRPQNLNDPYYYKVNKGLDSEQNGLNECGNTDNQESFGHKLKVQNINRAPASLSYGSDLSTFELVITTTGEFHDENGGTEASAMAVVTATVSALNLIYKKELAVDFMLKDTKIYTDPGTDPFTAGGDSRTNQAAEAAEMNWPDTFYDVHETFHDTSVGGFASGGVAALGVICDDGTFFSEEMPDDGLSGPNKAAGWSGSSDNTDNDWYQLVTHEFGHQFGARHIWNGSLGSCTTANHSLTTAVEPGSGTTIMSYQGICGAQNIPDAGTSDNYFNVLNLDEMRSEISSVSCETVTASSNTPPSCDANPTSGSFTIPKSTPFFLTGAGSDIDGDELTYSWEQNNASATNTQGLLGSAAGSSPLEPALFRSFPPSDDPTRIFPSLEFILDGTNTGVTFEALAEVSRTLDFIFTVRDGNTESGGVCSSGISIPVDDSTGPFAVTTQNTSTSWTADGISTATIEWDVAGTDGGSVLCADVDILFSADNGQTFPYTLASATTNDGSHVITIPNLTTTQGRVMVKCSDNIFFDINNSLITITSTCLAEGVTFSPDADISAEAGDPILDLTLTPDFGSMIVTFDGEIDVDDPPTTLVRYTSTADLTCDLSSNGIQYEEISFIPDVTGSYAFDGIPTPLTVNLYSDTFFPFSPCTNWLGSSVVGTSVDDDLPHPSTSLTGISLTAGETYVLVISNFSTSGGFPTLPASYSITYTGPGDLLTGPIEPSPVDYDYTYVISDLSGTIVAIEADPDLTGFAIGTYTLCGLSYESSEVLTPYIGVPLADLQDDLLTSVLCGNKSANSIEIEITTCVDSAPPTLQFCTETLVASGSSYDDGWDDMDSAVDGFGPWGLGTTGASGHFIGSSTGNGAPPLDASDGDIDSMGDAFGLFAVADGMGSEAIAITTFDIPMMDGSILTFSMDNGLLEPFGEVGIVLQNSVGEEVITIKLLHDVFPYTYDIEGAAITDTPVEFEFEGFDITVIQTSPTSADVLMTSLGTGVMYTFPGIAYASPPGGSEITGLRLYSFEANFPPPLPGPPPSMAHDVFFNNFQICHPCAPDVTVMCGEEFDFGITGEPTATDDCDPAPVITFSDSPPGLCPAVITRTWTATDASGASSTCIQEIIVIGGPACPDLTAAAPVVEIVSESSCDTPGGTPSGGLLGVPLTSCPAGSTIEYSTNGIDFSETLPDYDQTTSITVTTRCNCDADDTINSPTSEITTSPGLCPDCPDLTAAAPVVEIVSESSCDTPGGTPSGGLLGVPLTSCPVGSTIEYSTNGIDFSETLPDYDQITSITVTTRCNCDADDTINSPTSEITTSPGSCPDCPDLTSAAPVVEIVSESSCDTPGGTPSGGLLGVPLTSCPAGSTIEYSTNGIDFSETLPDYDQITSITVTTRCNCDADDTINSPTSEIITSPGLCPDCPDLTAAAPVVEIVSESSCDTPGGTPSGGLLGVPLTSCPVGSTIEYSINGIDFSETLPDYDQTTSITVTTRCNCDADDTINSPTSEITTSPGLCPDCPDLTAAAPVVEIVSESSCDTPGGTPSGGLLGVPLTSCPVGSTIEYSTNGIDFSVVLPDYEQTTSITVTTRCNCDADDTINSPTSEITSSPGACPGCPDLSSAAPEVEIILESVCTEFEGTPSGGLLGVPLTSCPAGSTIEYSTNGIDFSETLPDYDQTTSITVTTRCNCDADDTINSPTSEITTSPGLCPDCPDLTAAAPVVEIVAESSCDTPGGTPSGGLLGVPLTSCPAGSTLEYSTNGIDFSVVLPDYEQTTSITVTTRCNCDANDTINSPTSEITTSPGDCPVCLPPTPCDDGDPCTTGDVERLDTIGGTCVPCSGILDPTSCASACVTFVSCDDSDPDTVDDIVGLAADGSICVPCAGVVPDPTCDGLVIEFNLPSIIIWETTPVDLSAAVTLSHTNGDPVSGSGVFNILDSSGIEIISDADEIPFSLPIGEHYILEYIYTESATSGDIGCTETAVFSFKILSIGCD